MQITLPFTKKQLFIGLGVVLALLILIPAVSYFVRYQQAKTLLKDPEKAAKAEIAETLDKVKRLVAVPGEEPTLATVTDPSKLKDKTFFAAAQNGDKVLIFEKSKKAILYRPSADRVIEMSPVNIGEVPTPTLTEAPKSMRVGIYNGTETPKLANKAQGEIQSVLPQYEVVYAETANKQDYTKTIVVDMSGERKEEAQKLADIVGGSVGEMPKTELARGADFVIIVGADYQ